MHRTVPVTKNYLAPNITRAMMEKARSRFWAYSNEQNNDTFICLLCLYKMCRIYKYKCMFYKFGSIQYIVFYLTLLHEHFTILSKILHTHVFMPVKSSFREM